MSGELLGRRERKLFDVLFHSEAQYENHDSKVTVNHFITRPLFLGGLAYIHHMKISTKNVKTSNRSSVVKKLQLNMFKKVTSFKQKLSLQRPICRSKCNVFSITVSVLSKIML